MLSPLYVAREFANDFHYTSYRHRINNRVAASCKSRATLASDYRFRFVQLVSRCETRSKVASPVRNVSQCLGATFLFRQPLSLFASDVTFTSSLAEASVSSWACDNASRLLPSNAQNPNDEATSSNLF